MLRRLVSGRLPDWGRLAAEAGYADQAHLVRDFRQFAGTTPKRFLAGTAPPGWDRAGQGNFVQDTATAAS